MQKYIKVFHQLFFPLKKIVPYTKQNQLKTLIQKKKPQPLLHLLCKIPEKIHYFNHCLNIFCSEHNDSTNRSQSSTEFVLESRSYNKKSLIQISAAAPAAISRKQKRMKCP